MISGNVNRWGVACLLLISLYFASTSAPRADFELSRGWFGELGDEDRVALQTDLTLAGFYDAIIDGAFGPSTYRALTAFQKWNGDTATGVLDGTAMRALSRAAQSVFEELGLEIVHDEGGKLEIAVPRALLPDTSRTSVGTAYTRPDGFMRLDTVSQSNAVQSYADLYQQLSTENSRRDVTYRTLRDEYFVVSGVLDGEYFYSLMFANGDFTSGFTVRWTERYTKQGSIVALFLASFASPWSDDLSPAPELAPSPVLPASDAEAVIQIGSFQVLRESPGVIWLRGDIGASTPLDFRRAVRAAGIPKVLFLASDGGYVSSALLLAYEVKEMGLATYVPPNAGCYSACAFVFFAGEERSVDGALGVHQVWGEDTDASVAQTVVSDILEAFVDFGVRQEVTSAMLRTRPEEMYVFSAAELTQWGILKGNPSVHTAAENPVSANSDIGRTILPKSAGQDITERTVPISKGTTLSAVLGKEGLVDAWIFPIERVFRENGVDTYLPAGTAIKILFGRTIPQADVVPYRVTFHQGGESTPITFGVALADNGDYVALGNGEKLSPTTGEKGPRRGTSAVESFVQLYSTRTEEAALAAAQEIASQFGSLFAGADLEVQRVDLGPRGIFYRIRVSAPSAEAAGLLCSRLKQAGRDCFVL
jgi:hypothetical protein